MVDIHATQTARISTILTHGDPQLVAEFEASHQGLRDNLNWADPVS